MKSLTSLLFLFFFGTIKTQAQIYYVQTMSTVEIAALDRERTVVILPGGILEEHGPYLPSFCDGYQNEALTIEIAHSIIKHTGWKVLIFPIIPLGTGGANEIGRKYIFSGTFAVRHNTLRSIFMDLGTELGEQGFKKIFVVHMHGAPNHNQAIDQACDFFSDTYKGRMVNIWNLAYTYDEDLRDSTTKNEDGFTPHAGFDEHSILYYLKPDLKKQKYIDARPITAKEPGDMHTLAKKNDWPGYFGSPRFANPVLGKKIWKGWTTHILLQVDSIMDNRYDFSKPTYYQVISKNTDNKLIDEDAKNYEKKNETKQIKWLKSKGFDQ